MRYNKYLLVLDLDGTLTKSDNIVRFSLYMIKSLNLKFLLAIPLILLLKIKTIDNYTFKILYSKYILKNLKVDKLDSCVNKYIKSCQFTQDVNIELSEHLKQYTESEKLLISANYSFLVKPISHYFDIPNSISIINEIKNNKFTGSISGIIPYGNNKIGILKNFLKNKEFKKIIGFADSQSDMPLLAYLDEGYLVKYNRRNCKTTIKKFR